MRDPIAVLILQLHLGLEQVNDLALGLEICLGDALTNALGVLVQMVHLLSRHLDGFQ